MKLKSTSRTPLPPRSLAFTLAPGGARVGDAEFSPVGPCRGRGMMLYKIQLGDHYAHYTEATAVSLGIGPGQPGDGDLPASSSVLMTLASRAANNGVRP